MVYLTGDWHGGAEEPRLNGHFFPEGRRLSKSDLVVVAGDFGLPWDFSADEAWDMGRLANRPWTTCFVDGNHERFDWLAGHLAEVLCRECRRDFYDNAQQRFLEEVDQRLEYKTWFFGHYHGDEWRDDKHRLTYVDVVPIDVDDRAERKML